MSMFDNFGRNINNMRISVTQKCNLDCFYCHREGENGGYGCSVESSDNCIMTPSEIEKITKVASKVGIEKLKITGGEPLLRKDIVEIVRRVKKHMKEISMTTNGVLLEKYAYPLKNAGLKRVNISYDALDPQTFKIITKNNYYYDVKRGVKTAIKVGLNPVKLNMVILKGINNNEIPYAIEFASSVGAVLQLIEFECSGDYSSNSLFTKHHCNLIEIERKFEDKAIEIRERKMHRRKKYILASENNGKAEVEIVRGMHNSLFCKNCTRLRVTSKGELKPCLLRDDNHIDIIDPIRHGADDKELINLFKKAIQLKEPYWRE